jgi:hypothetical protein
LQQGRDFAWVLPGLLELILKLRRTPSTRNGMTLLVVSASPVSDAVYFKAPFWIR